MKLGSSAIEKQWWRAWSNHYWKHAHMSLKKINPVSNMWLWLLTVETPSLFRIIGAFALFSCSNSILLQAKDVWYGTSRFPSFLLPLLWKIWRQLSSAPDLHTSQKPHFISLLILLAFHYQKHLVGFEIDGSGSPSRSGSFHLDFEK